MSSENNFYGVDSRLLARHGVFESLSDDLDAACLNIFSTLITLVRRSGTAISADSQILVIARDFDDPIRILDRVKSCTAATVSYVSMDGKTTSKTSFQQLFDNPVVCSDSTAGSARRENGHSGVPQSYDVILSDDTLSFVRADQWHSVLQIIANALKPQGMLAIAPVLASDICSDSDRERVSHILRLPKLSSINDYEKDLNECALSIFRARDLSLHLRTSYRKTIAAIKLGCSPSLLHANDYLQPFPSKDIENLKEILFERDVLAWQALIAKKEIIQPYGNSTQSATQVQMTKRFLSAKLHNIGVTAKNVSYHGSAGICKKLMAEVGIQPYEAVELANCRNGQRWTTYAIPVDTKGSFELNGAAARLGEVGDECIVLVYGLSHTYVPAKVLVLDASRNNEIVDSFHYTVDSK